MDIDVSDFKRLIEELTKLNSNLAKKSPMDDGQTKNTTASKSFDTSARNIVNAIGALNSTLHEFRTGIAKSDAERSLSMQRFTDSIDEATQSQEELSRSAAEFKKSLDDAAAAAQESQRRASLTAEQRAKEDQELSKQAHRARTRAELDAADKNKTTTLENARRNASYGSKMFQDLGQFGSNTFKVIGEDAKASLDDFAIEKLGLGSKGLARFSTGIDIGARAVSAFSEGLYKGITTYASSLYRGQRGFEASAKAMTATVQPLLEFADTLGNILAVAAWFLPGGAIVKGLRYAGAAILKFGAATGQAAAKLNELQGEQLDKTMKAFRDISTVGAATAGGIEDVFDGMQKLGLTTQEIEQFTEVIVKNSKNLALFGGTVADGRLKFQDVANGLIKSGLGTELERLGMTTKEQTRSTMNYMALQARLGQLQNKNTTQLIRESQAYAKEMEALARLTGQSREEAEEARAQAMAEDQFAAAMDLAKQQGDTEYQQQLQNAEMIAQILRSQGRTEDAKEVLRMGAARGAATSDRQGQMLLSGYGEAIKAGSREEALRRLQTGLSEAEERFRGVAANVPAGELPYKYAAERDTRTLITGKSIDEINANIDKQTKDTSKRTEAAIGLERTQKEMAQKLDSAAFKLLDVAKMHEMASKNLNQAADTLIKWTGTKSTAVAGGGFDKGKEAPPAPPGTASAAPSAVRVATTEREKAETAEKEAREKLKQARRENASAEDIKKLRLQEYEARREAERARLIEQSASKKQGQAAIMGVPPAPQVAPPAPKPAAPAPAAPAATAPPAPKPAAPAPAPVAPATTAPTPTPAAPATTQGTAPATKAASASPIQAPVSDTKSTQVQDLAKLFTFTANSGSQENFEKLDDDFKQKVIAAAQEYNQISGNKLQVNSAYRSREDQQRLWDESIQAGRPGLTPQGRPIANPNAAGPTTSSHLDGRAIDIQNFSDPVAYAALRKQGLNNPIRNDAVHFMKFGGVVDAKMGGTRTLLAEAGMNEAVVPLPDGKNIPVSLNVENLVDKMQLKQVDIVNGLTETLKTAMNNITSTVNNQTGSIDAESLAKEMSRMSDKLEQVLDVLSSSKDIQSSLLSYSMN